MVGQIAEGIESIRLPCSWVLMFAAAAVAIYARRRSWIAIGAFALAAVVVAWLRFSSWWIEAPSGATQVLSGIAIIAATVNAWKRNSPSSDAVLGSVVGTVAVWSWLPCVGPELADILNDAPSRPFANLAGTIAFLVGLLLPILLVAAADIAIPAMQRALDKPWIAGFGALLLISFGVLFAGAWSDELSSQLLSRSSF